MPIASTILMIRPAAFGVNKETAVNNFFQSQISAEQEEFIQQAAQNEFNRMENLLRRHRLRLIVIDDTPFPPKPSAIFPNNWLSTSPEGNLYVYPLFAPSRRAEKREDIITLLSEKFEVHAVQDWSEYEVEGKFLEGTGSMVMDHDNKIIYACYSPRTDIRLLEKFAQLNGYRAIAFAATDKNGHPVYHTNVVMALGEGFAVLCEESIEEEWERIAVQQLLESTGHEIIGISRDQMHSFAGNLLQVQNEEKKKLLIISQTAFDALRNEQKSKLSCYGELLPVEIPTIEKTEGGSVRCMMAEIFLKAK